MATTGPPAKRTSTPSDTSVELKLVPSKERNKEAPAADCWKVIIKPPSIQKVAGRLNADDGMEVTLRLEAGSQKVTQRPNADDGVEVTPRLEAGSQKVTALRWLYVQRYLVLFYLL